jgi:hypothetical protein
MNRTVISVHTAGQSGIHSSACAPPNKNGTRKRFHIVLGGKFTHTTSADSIGSFALRFVR